MSQPTSARRRDVMIRMEAVSKHFQMGEVTVQALHDVTLDLYHAELLVVAGPSGSGKTTLLNVIGGLIRPTSGRLWFDGQELSALSESRLNDYRRRWVGFVFQFYNLVPTLTARENVMVAAELSDDPLDPDELLQMVGLEERTHHFPSQLSGGEQQRVAIARALAKNPQLVLCDEPIGAVDFATGKRVLSMLVELSHRLGKTVMIITHNLAVGQIADRTIRLRSGEMVEVHVNERPMPPEEITW